MYDNFNDPLGFDRLTPAPEANKSMADEIAQQTYDQCMLIKRVFSTKDGKVLLDFLRKNTLEASTWKPSPNHEWAVATGFAREGQNALIRMLVCSIEAASKSKEPSQCHELLSKMGVL